MGTWNFQGGLIWNGDGFQLNNGIDFNVGNEADRAIQLSESHLLLPGLIDFHCHVWAPGAALGVTSKEYLSSGIMACTDAGTFGYRGWEDADRLWRNSSLEIRSWLSVLPEGLTIHPNPEPTPPDRISMEQLLATASTAGSRLMGFKIRLGEVDATTDRGLLRVARAAAEKAGTKIMTHLSGTFLPVEEVVESLRPGDVLTHPYHGRRGNILDYRGKISGYFKSAVEQGLLLDVAHASKHFTWKVYRQAIAEGLKPNTISTDLTVTTWKKPPVYDLSFVLSRFIAAGLPKDEVFASVLNTPACLMNLEIDSSKNLIVMEADHSEVHYTDAQGEALTGTIQYIPKLFINKGQVVFSNGLFSTN